MTWLGYGHPAPPRAGDADALLDRFMPTYEIVERHHIGVAAPAAVTLDVAREVDFQAAPVVRTLIRAREDLLGATPDTRRRLRGLLAETQSLGWGVLAAAPGAQSTSEGSAPYEHRTGDLRRPVPAETNVSLIGLISVQRHPLIWFYALAYVFSWVFWMPAAAAGLGWIDPVPSVFLHFAGGLGPMVSGILVTWLAGDRTAVARLRARSVTGGAWIVAAVLIPATLFVISALVVALAYGTRIDWQATGLSTEAPDLPRPVFWLANLVFYGYGEEVGWRGFALPRLQSRFSALRASLLLTIAWAGWHIPLFGFTGGLSTLDAAGVVGWLLSLALGSILLTWLFNSSRGSIAAVAVFHAVLDIFITSPVSPNLPNVMGALLTISTILLIPIVGAQHLAVTPRVTEPLATRHSPQRLQSAATRASGSSRTSRCR